MKSLLKKIIPKYFRDLIRGRGVSISSGHIIIQNPNREALKKEFENTWRNDSIPGKQMKITHSQLPNFEKVAPMKAAVELLSKINSTEQTLLDVGCSTGYYSEVFKRSGLDIKYQGCDYSSTFIEKARQMYPKLKFEVCDSTQLPYPDKSFDILFSGCCILHIIDYEKAIAESARVSKKYVIFHRTPVIHMRPTTFVKKNGYGIPMIEICFNESELLDLFNKNGLSVIDTNIHGELVIDGLGEKVISKSYLCQKY